MTEPGVVRVIIEQRDDAGAWDGVFFADLRPRDYGYIMLMMSGVNLAAFYAAPAVEQAQIIHKLAAPQPAPASLN